MCHNMWEPLKNVCFFEQEYQIRNSITYVMTKYKSKKIVYVSINLIYASIQLMANLWLLIMILISVGKLHISMQPPDSVWL